MKGKTHKPRKILRLLLVPLLLLVIMQAVLSFGAVILGGTFSSLKSYAANRLEQVTETRQIILEGKMNGQWTELAEEYAATDAALFDFLEEENIPLETFLSDRTYHEIFLTQLVPDYIYLLRTSSTTGAFLVLASENMEEGGSCGALYLRDGDPDSNPADYSDLLLAVGPSVVSQQNKISLDINWTSQLSLLPRGQREADSFVYAPYFAAEDDPTQDAKNLCYWSRPFRLEDNPSDSYRMITYTMPLILDGRVWGVIGVEISLPYLAENLPYLEVDSDHRGGYLLLEKTGEDEYYILYASGPNAGQFSMGIESISPEKTDAEGLEKVVKDKKTSYLALKALRLYNTNTPFYERGWYLAGLEDHETLFGISDLLMRIFIIATLFSLLVALVLALILVQFVTNPIRQLSACIQHSPEDKLGDFPPSYVFEVNELYNTIRRLNERQKQIEYDLMEEKERYHLALQSSSDILISHEIENDRTIFHNLREGEHEEIVEGLFSGKSEGYIHPDDIRIVSAQLGGTENKVNVSFRMDLTGKGENYRWYELDGSILSAENLRPKMLIGAMHDIHDQKMQEMAAFESLHRDSLTGLYRRASGENIIENSLRSSEKGSLLLLDVKGLKKLNEKVGLVAGNAVLEEAGRLIFTLTKILRSVLVRMGGDEFLIYLEDAEKADAEEVFAALQNEAEKIYVDGDFSLQFSHGAAERTAGESYSSLLRRAAKELLIARGKDAEKFNLSDVFSQIEFSSPNRAIVPLTFAMFDKGAGIGAALPLLFPKFARELQVKDLIFSEINRDFFTSAMAYRWRGYSAEKEGEVVHYSPEEFRRIENTLMEESSAAKLLSELTREQRRFLRAPEEGEGICFPLFDSGRYFGNLIFTLSSKEAWDAEKRGELYEIVKVIESNLNRERYDAASRAKSDFLSRMSHEIRTPMNAIIGMTYIAKTHLSGCENEEIKGDLEKIDASSHYLLGLINDILDMSRIESGKLTLESASFDLNEFLRAIKDLIAPQAEAKNIAYTENKKILHPFVAGDELRLKQVAINLLGNAVKFTPEGGKIIFSVLQNEGGDIYFSVKDTGIGVSEENRERIFRSFEQAENSTVRKYGGTGLGLSISSRLVQMMGGVINLESELGKGSDFSFTIHLPVLKAQGEVEKKEEETFEEASIEGVKILLVEDNELNIEIAQSILEMYGAVITTAKDGKEAVETFEKSKEGDFDLILMDIQMPVMDGLEATKRIRNLKHPAAQSIPIVAMTANAFDEDMKRSVESGMNGHLSKPLDFEKLIHTICGLLKKE